MVSLKAELQIPGPPWNVSKTLQTLVLPGNMVGKVKTTVALLVFVAFFQMAPVLSAISKVTSSNSCHVDSVTLGAKRAGSVGLRANFCYFVFLPPTWMDDWHNTTILRNSRRTRTGPRTTLSHFSQVSNPKHWVTFLFSFLAPDKWIVISVPGTAECMVLGAQCKTTSAKLTDVMISSEQVKEISPAHVLLPTKGQNDITLETNHKEMTDFKTICYTRHILTCSMIPFSRTPAKQNKHNSILKFFRWVQKILWLRDSCQPAAARAASVRADTHSVLMCSRWLAHFLTAARSRMRNTLSAWVTGSTRKVTWLPEARLENRAGGTPNPPTGLQEIMLDHKQVLCAEGPWCCLP